MSPKAFAAFNIFAAGTLSKDWMENAFIRILHLPQSEALVSRLSAAFSFSFFSQTFRCRTIEITRWRLTAIMAVFINYSLETGDFLLKRIKPINKRGDQSYNSVFPLPVDCSDIIFRHLNRHIRKLLSGASACIVSYVNQLYFKEPATPNVVAYRPDIYERPPVKLLPLFLVGVAKTNNINQRSLS